jgi:signal transduction histidine kinase
VSVSIARSPDASAAADVPQAAPDLLRPHRLLLTRRPWAAVLYLAAETAGGSVILLGAMSLVLLPLAVMLMVPLWPRIEVFLLPLVGQRVQRSPRRRWEAGWRDLALVLLTPVLALCVLVAGFFLLILIPMLLGVPVAILLGRRITGLDAEHVLPSMPTAVVAPALGLLLLFLALWGATALAAVWGRLNAALLADVEERLAGQVEELAGTTVRREDAIALERRALERDLHDGAQMHLGAAGMRLGLLQLSAEALDEGPVRAGLLRELDAVREQVELAAGSVRAAAAGLVPAALRDGGLPAALGEATAALPVETELDCEVPRLDAAVEQGLDLIAREALTNVVRHARASRVRVRCGVSGVRPDAVLLEIWDDGRGGATPTGTGLLSMRARARALGGELRLSSPDGGPTLLSVAVPLACVEAPGSNGPRTSPAQRGPEAAS